MTRALAMISGGLDSILASKLLKDQGIEVIGICFKSHFFSENNAVRMAKQIDIPLVVVDFSEEHFKMVKNPPHGYGKNVNPCIDCHAMMMKYAGSLLEKYNAQFIITGEVLNQRPMSQNRSALGVVLKESGVGEKVLRPLCAKNLPPTQMELDGLVDREKLLDIAGRSRHVQMELAEKWGIKDYPSPAGGCKLTEPNYSVRLKDLMNYKEEIDTEDLELLKIGRHFRLTENAKIISTRTQQEALDIKKYLKSKDLIFLADKFVGAMTIIVGEPNQEEIEFAAKVTARYSKGREESIVRVNYGEFKKPMEKHVEVEPATDELISKFILN